MLEKCPLFQPLLLQCKASRARTALSKNPADLEVMIEQHLHGALGYEVATFVRTPGELRDTIDIRGDELHHPDHSVYVAFTHSAPDSTVCDALVALESGTDRFEFRGREVC